MNNIVRRVYFSQKFGRLFAVKIRKTLKINIMQKSANCPKIRIVFVTKRFCKVTHNPFNSECMKNMKIFLVVFFQKSHSLVSCNIQFHNNYRSFRL